MVALALSLIFGRHAALSQPATRPLDALGYTLVVVEMVTVDVMPRLARTSRTMNHRHYLLVMVIHGDLNRAPDFTA